MKYIFLLFTTLAWASQSDAQNTSKDSVQQITLDTLTVSVPAGPQPYRGAATKTWDIKNTRIALSFNWKEKTADAREWIKLHPYFYATDSLVLDAKSMRIDSVMLVGKKGNTTLQFSYGREELRIHFDKVYKATDTIELFLKYTAMPYTNPDGGSMAITDDKGLYFINTDYKIPNKPAQIWTQGETESNSHWMITIDKPNTRFTSQVELTVPDSLTTLSNGALSRQVKSINGMRTDTWKMDMPIQAYAVMFAIGRYDIVKERWRNKEVNYYVEPKYAPYAKAMFKNTPEMIEYFSQRTGVAYPWNKYSQVVVRDYVSGAMENTSATLLGEFMNANAREVADRSAEDIVSHELFHQWFGDYVTCESWSNLTLNESFANYGEQLWRAHKYGKDAGDELSRNDLMIYVSSSEYNDPQLVRYYYDSREDMFDAISYNKGGAILRYMNKLMGDAAFDRAMNIYLTKNALHSAEAHNWRMAVEEATGQEWNWFFNQWYYHAGHPVLKVSYNYNDTLQKLIVTVSQMQSDTTYMYNCPIKAALLYGSSKTVLDWNISKRKESFTYEYKNGQKPVIVPDYTYVLPGEVKDGKSPEQWYAQFVYNDDYMDKRLALTGCSRVMSDSFSQVVTDLALHEKIPSIRLEAVSRLRGAQIDKYQKRWTPRIIELSKTDSSNLVRAQAFGVLGDWKVTTEKQSMVKALSDSSYSVAGAALEAINKLDKDTAYLLAKQLLPNDPRAALENSIWSIIGKKAADEDIVLFEKYAPYFFNSRRFTMTSCLSNYLKNVKSDDSYRRGAEIYATLVSTENVKNFRMMFSGSFFQIASDQKDNLKSEKKDEAERAKKRMEILKSSFDKIIEAEHDPENLKDFKKRIKNIFE